MIAFRVNGTPAPQGSKRHVGGGRMVESSKAAGPWREAVRAEAQRAMVVREIPGGVEWLPPLPDPVSVTAVFVLARPKGHYGTGRNDRKVRDSAPRFPAGRPDVDKLARAVLDGLVMGGVMADDAQVVDLRATKVYAVDGEPPGVILEVKPW